MDTDTDSFYSKDRVERTIDIPLSFWTSGMSMRVKPTTLAVYLAILSHTRWTDGACYPTHRLIASEANVSLRTVSRAIADMVNLGMLIEMPDSNGKRLYAVTLPHAWAKE